MLGHRPVPVPVPVPDACRKAPTPRLSRVRGDGTELWAVTPPIGADGRCEPLHGGRYVLVVELVDDARGLRVRASRRSPRP